MAQMTQEELISAVNAQSADAKEYDKKDFSNKREWALRFSEGEVDFPAMGEKRSTFVSKDVADTHSLILPGVLRVFFSSTSIGVYEPTRREHDEYAEQATDLVNYEIIKECDGYMQFRSAISDGLLFGNGIMKHWWDKTPEYSTEEYTGQTEDERLYILEDPDFAEEIESKMYPDPDWQEPTVETLDPQLIQGIQAGDPQALEALQTLSTHTMLYDFKIKRYRNRGRLRVIAIPNEEFRICRSARVLDETVPFCEHIRKTTRSELIKEGFDKAKVKLIPRYDAPADDDEERSIDSEDSSYPYVASDKATEMVIVRESYILIDFDGDGIAERRRVVMGGATGNKTSMLLQEEWGDELPFSDLVPDPRPHKFRGRGLYDDTADIQRVKTVITRGILDNTYQQLVPQRDMEEGSYMNPDEVYNPTFGGVAIRRPGKQPFVSVVVPYIVDKMAPVLDYMDATAEKRTGISQRSQALDLDALQNQSATAVNAAQSSAYSKTEEYALNIAHGIKRVYSCCLKLITKHQDRAKVIRLAGDWKEINPTGWNADMDVTVNTGLGTGSRERDFTILQAVAAKQEQFVAQFGPYNPKLNVGHIMDTYQKMAEASGIRNPDSFFPSITQEEVAQKAEEQANQPPPADPRIQIEKDKLELETMKAQAKDQLDQQKAAASIELENKKQMASMALQQQANEMTLSLQRDKQAMDLQLQREKQAMELQHKEQVALLDARLKQQEMELEARLTEQANLMKLSFTRSADVNVQEQQV